MNIIIIIDEANRRRETERLRMHHLHVKISQRTTPITQSSLNGCEHQFCIRCIRKWSKVNPAPLRPKIHARYAENDTTRSDTAIGSSKSPRLPHPTYLPEHRSFHSRIPNSEGSSMYQCCCTRSRSAFSIILPTTSWRRAAWRTLRE